MNNHCKNCGNPIMIAIFKGGDWCCEDCRKELAAKSRMKCEYEYVGPIPVCQIHGESSKYAPNRGPNRPCLIIEPYDFEDDFAWQ